MARLILQILLLFGCWFGALLGSLKLAASAGDFGGHTICGPWGCGPPLQALVGCHLAWVVMLTPAVIGAGVLQARAVWWFGLVATLAGVSGLIALGAWQATAWLPHVNEQLQGYFPQRYLFMLAVTVDYPIVQTLLAGIGLLWRSRVVSRRERCDPAAGERSDRPSASPFRPEERPATADRSSPT